MARIVTHAHPRALAGVLDVAALAVSCASVAVIMTIIFIMADVSTVVDSSKAPTMLSVLAFVMVPGIACWLHVGHGTAKSRGYWFPLDTAVLCSSWYVLGVCVWGVSMVGILLSLAIETMVSGGWNIVYAVVLPLMALPSARIISQAVLSVVALRRRRTKHVGAGFGCRGTVPRTAPILRRRLSFPLPFGWIFRKPRGIVAVTACRPDAARAARAVNI